ncbi:MAG: prolyl oligopeptidase family serine peptidase [Planctomycetota bacterium]
MRATSFTIAVIRATAAITIIALLATVTANSLLAQDVRNAFSSAPDATVPPPTRSVSLVESYHGVEVSDAYRWLEQTEHPETRAWVTAQNAYTARQLDSPHRSAIKQRLTELWNYERWGVPRVHGGRTFYSYNDGLSNQARLYVIDKPGQTPRLLLDPNTMAADGTVSLASWKVSPDGRFLAYSVSDAGSDLRWWRIRDVQAGYDLVDAWRCSDVVWNANSQSLFYVRHERQPAGTTDRGRYVLRLFEHSLGQSFSRDQQVYERGDDRAWSLEPRVTEDGRYLVLRISSGMSQRSQLLVKDLLDPHSPTRPITPLSDAQYSFVGNRGSQFWLLTDRDAPRGRIVLCDIAAASDVPSWQTWIEEREDLLVGASRCGGRWIVRYLRDAMAVVKLFDGEGRWLQDLPLPGLGTVTGFESHSSDTDVYYGFTSYTTPLTIYRFQAETLESTVYRIPQLAASLADYETTQFFYTSTDGTQVPLLIVGRREGPQPTLLYGYGGFQINVTPSFSVANLVWLELGGLLAVPNIRGGGEYGRAWHEAGSGASKEQSFEDFIAAARFLLDHHHTSPSQLAIHGSSNGGLLVGVAATRHPELFAAALPHVGVFDMLRYQHFSMGAAWIPEYGSSDRATDFARLWNYSPLHRVRADVSYPPMLITTADHDDRVTPAHSYKFAATLQATSSAASRPILLRVDERVGHGSGTPTSKLIAGATDSLVFLTTMLNVKIEERAHGK